MAKSPDSKQIQIPLAVNVLIRFLSVAVLIYSAMEVYLGIDNGYIVRRGIQYTLEEEPRSFMINLGKWAVIACVCLYVSINGIPTKTSKSQVE